MMNVVGNLKYLESTIKDLLDIGSVELTDSLSQIENNTFIVNINSENIEKTMEFNNVTGFENRDVKDLNSIADNLKDIFKIDLKDERLKESTTKMKSKTSTVLLNLRWTRSTIVKTKLMKIKKS